MTPTKDDGTIHIVSRESEALGSDNTECCYYNHLR